MIFSYKLISLELYHLCYQNDSKNCAGCNLFTIELIKKQIFENEIFYQNKG
jgi:hypothetical protein